MSFNASSIQPFEYVPGVENLGPRWTSWMDRLEQYFTASGYDNDAKMNAALLFLAGESVSTLYETLKTEVIPDSANVGTKVYDQTKYRLNQFFTITIRAQLFSNRKRGFRVCMVIREI
jgi:hypothetical protein